MHGAIAENPSVQKKSRSRSNSPDHNRSVSICNIPSVAGESIPAADTEGECDPYHIKCIEQLLNDAEGDVSFTKAPESGNKLRP